jgi:hypothetical protein
MNRGYIARTGDTGSRELIRDVYTIDIMRNEVVTESVGGVNRKVLKVGGRFQFANRLNANQRIYPRAVLEQAIEEIQDDVKARGVLGEYDHPPDAKIHLDRVSHLITKLWMEGDEVYGECEVLEKLPLGAQLKGLIESGVRIGISSRGVGDMESSIHEGDECYKVLPGYQFVTFDMVAEPSVHGSYMTVKEGKERRRKSVLKRRNMREERERQILKTVKNILRGKK